MEEMVLSKKQTPIEIALDIDATGHTTARKLYAWLELDHTQYSRWVKQNITENPYAEEGLEFSTLMSKTSEVGGRPSSDYLLSASFAKKLAMTSRSPKGEETREYFLKVEDALVKVSQVKLSSPLVPSMEDKLLVVKAVGEDLRMNDASKIAMYTRFCKQEKIGATFLPSYEDNGGRQLIAATSLLKEFGLEASIHQFNKAMIEHGFLEERERDSSKKATKKFKALTESGKKYGENQIPPQNPREVQPLYYKDSFRELYDILFGLSDL